MSLSKINLLPLQVSQTLKKKRETYINSLKGRDGIDGKDGKDGINGTNGINGINGIDGKDGLNGKQGIQGIQGPKGDRGKDGKDGRGIVKVWIDLKGDLHIEYTDNVKQNLGRVKGHDGLTQTVFAGNGSSALGVVNTSTSETIILSYNSYIRQTAGGITTSLSGAQVGMITRIKNASDNPNTLGITIDGCTNPIIEKNESFTIVYNGTDWDLI